MAEQLIAVGDVELCAESFGVAADPAILLITGASGSMDWWPVPFCQLLVAAGRRVIRYDHRDTGRSTHWPAGAPGYASADLITDAVGLLDAFDIPEAHVVGLSMGGAIAQQLALNHPDRISSITLIATTAGPGD